MRTPEDYLVGLWPLGVYFAAVLLVVAGMVIAAYFLGQRRKQPAALWSKESSGNITTCYLKTRTSWTKQDWRNRPGS